MATPAMDHALIDGVELAYTARGSGEPVVLIHGALAGAFRPLVAEPALAERYRIVTYHRRGYPPSVPSAGPRSIPEQAADTRALLKHLGIDRAHVVGHSYGGNVALQLALDAPETVRSLALLEPALPAVLLTAPEFGAALGEVFPRYAAGDRAGALDAFLRGACGPDYRAAFDRALGPEAFAEAVAAADTLFQHDLPALQSWSFTPDDARRIAQPVLAVVGAESGPVFDRIQEAVRTSLPQAEEFVLPGANHLLMVMNAPALADALAAFLARHPIAARAS
jgi:pimeloyl-ACP methyl ester carboxylesterase